MPPRLPGAANDLAITVLRTEPAVLRQFLQTASSANSFIRSTLRQPARTQEALREKLGLLRSEALALRNAAGQLALRSIASSCQALMTDLDALLAKDALSGDDMLPLALRLDPISAAIGAAATSRRAASRRRRCRRRHLPPPPAHRAPPGRGVARDLRAAGERPDPEIQRSLRRAGENAHEGFGAGARTLSPADRDGARTAAAQCHQAWHRDTRAASRGRQAGGRHGHHHLPQSRCGRPRDDRARRWSRLRSRPHRVCRAGLGIARTQTRASHPIRASWSE